MTTHTPPELQGQIVIVSYGWHDGCLYRRTYDRSDRTERWALATDDEEVNAYIASGGAPHNAVPPIATWSPCAEPDGGQED